MKFLPISLKKRLVEGYLDGDGCYQESIIYAASVSKELITSLQDILLSLGLASSTLKKFDAHDEVWTDGKVVHKKDRYEIHISKFYKNKLFEELGRTEDIVPIQKKCINKNVYFSDDLSKIYVKVEKVENTSILGKCIIMKLSLIAIHMFVTILLLEIATQAEELQPIGQRLRLSTWTDKTRTECL